MRDEELLRCRAQEVVLWRWKPGDEDAERVGMQRLVYAEAQATYVVDLGFRPDVRYFELLEYSYIAVGDGELPTYMTDFVRGYLAFQAGARPTYDGPEVVRSLADAEEDLYVGDDPFMRALSRGLLHELGDTGSICDVDLNDPQVVGDVFRCAADVRARDRGEAPMLQIQPRLDHMSPELVWDLLPSEVRGQLRYLHLPDVQVS